MPGKSVVNAWAALSICLLDRLSALRPTLSHIDLSGDHLATGARVSDEDLVAFVDDLRDLQAFLALCPCGLGLGTASRDFDQGVRVGHELHGLPLTKVDDERVTRDLQNWSYRRQRLILRLLRRGAAFPAKGEAG